MKFVKAAPSIQRQLSISLAMIIIVLCALIVQAGLWAVDKGLRSFTGNTLTQSAESILAALIRNPQSGKELELNDRHYDIIYQKPFSGRYFVVEIDGKVWRSRSLWDYELHPLSDRGFSKTLVDGPENQQLLIYQGKYERYQKHINVTVAQDYSPITDSIMMARKSAFFLGLVGIVLVLLLQRHVLKKALRPLVQTSAQIGQLRQGQRAQLDANVPVELLPVVAEINRLLTHTEETLKRSRNAVGNLGHALKTPLAVLVSLLARPEFQQHPELHNLVAEQLEQIQQRVGRQLNIARLSGEVLPGAHFSCTEELPALMQIMQMVHGEHLSLDWQAEEGLSLPWDREDLLEMLGNLLDNACKWAAHAVQLHIYATEQAYYLIIDDDGIGIDPELRQQVQNRGARLDEQTAGHGLGLGIVLDIVQSMHGKLELEESPQGGLRVKISLPKRQNT